jgi:hypothetical protein
MAIDLIAWFYALAPMVCSSVLPFSLMSIAIAPFTVLVALLFELNINFHDKMDTAKLILLVVVRKDAK